MRKNGGFILIGTVYLMLTISLFTASALPLYANQARTSLGLMQSAQARALAHAGIQYASGLLKSDTDWSDQTDLSNIALANGNFDVDYSLATTDRIKATVTARVPWGETTATRTYAVTFQRLPKAAQFAVYSASTALQPLQLIGTTAVRGNMYNRGDITTLNTANQSEGFAYVPQGSTTSAAVYGRQITNAPTAIPVIDTSFYTALIAVYNTNIAASLSAAPGDCTYNNATVTLTGNTVQCRDLNTAGNTTIQGHGKIVAWRNVNFQTNNGTTNINPSTGNIEILARGSILKTSTLANRILNILSSSGRVRLYAQNNAAANMIDFRGDSTNIDSALMMAGRRIQVRTSANVTGQSVLYITRNDPAAAQNNYIFISEAGTQVSGTVINLSDRLPNMAISTSAVMTGLVFSGASLDRLPAWGAHTGRVEINAATVNGSVIATGFRVGTTNNQIRNATITWAPSYLPSEIPKGFPTLVSVVPDSWEGV